MQPKEAIVLAGGLGTRLKGVVDDLPKPMAPVADKPFLEYVLDYLLQYDMNRVILSVGHKYKAIESYFGMSYKGCELIYAIEAEPLGTGGGIKNAMQFIKDEACYLLNGDTIFNVNLEELYSFYAENSFDLVLSLKEMRNFDRYGTVEMQNNRVTRFIEKSYKESGIINGGVYIINKEKFTTINFPVKFSFEKDYMEARVAQVPMGGKIFDAYFIDIGIPEDYNRAQSDFKGNSI